MNVTYLKDRSYRPAYVKKTEELLPYDLGDLLVGALWVALSELDGEQFGDMSDEQRARIRESM